MAPLGSEQLSTAGPRGSDGLDETAYRTAPEQRNIHAVLMDPGAAGFTGNRTRTYSVPRSSSPDRRGGASTDIVVAPRLTAQQSLTGTLDAPPNADGAVPVSCETARGWSGKSGSYGCTFAASGSRRLPRRRADTHRNPISVTFPVTQESVPGPMVSMSAAISRGRGCGGTHVSRGTSPLQRGHVEG